MASTLTMSTGTDASGGPSTHVPPSRSRKNARTARLPHRAKPPPGKLEITARSGVSSAARPLTGAKDGSTLHKPPTSR